MDKKILLVIMDGVGFSKTGVGDAVTLANTPTLDKLLAEKPTARLKAHGEAVGLPSDDDMGNSEVGHNALGCGQIYSQGAKLVNESIESGKIFGSNAWAEVLAGCKDGGSLHFIGLLSDGNVHSNISHLIAMITRAKADGVKSVKVHALLDGRDVPATSALTYVDMLEEAMAKLNDGDFNAEIASGGGRMKVTMDRYRADWDMVKNGWETHVHGNARGFASATDAINTFRNENSGMIDQDLPAFVIERNGEAVGKMKDGDGVILFNFRGDRAIEMSMAFDDEEFPYFDRGARPNVNFAGMLEYDGDLKIPKRYLVSPPEIKNTLSELLVANGIRQYAVSETQKYGHVTYFWNGNKSEKFSEELETFTEIPSDKVSFDERPWMKCAEVTDDVIAAIKSGKYDFIRCNFPNGDMVGHTGSLAATRCSMEALDIQLGRILPVVDKLGGVALITADHGNADEMFEMDKKTAQPKVSKDGKMKAKTSHTLNKVPCIIYDNTDAKAHYTVKADDGSFGLSNVAATMVNLLGYETPDKWDASVIELK